MTLNPAGGRGKNFNACVDCHAAMLRVAGKLMPLYEVDFVATGEVLGQRPMSQNAGALKRVAEMSLIGDLVMRPLSGQLLKENASYKFVPKEKQLDISGRSVTRQIQLSKEYDLKQLPSHGGGCLLTEISFGRKMFMLLEDGVLSAQNQFICKALQHGRLLKYAPRQYLVVGRNEADNI